MATGSDRNAYQMDWSEVFARMPVNDYAYAQFYEQYWDADDYYDARNRDPRQCLRRNQGRAPRHDLHRREGPPASWSSPSASRSRTTPPA